MNVEPFFLAAVQQGASDLHLVGGEKPTVRIGGTLGSLDEDVLDNAELKQGIFALLSEKQQERYEQSHELDVAISIGGGRFRINLHQQRGMIGLAARYIPRDIPTPQVLRFEQALLKAKDLRDGLVLVVGPTGSGKSTTLASLIEQINLNEKRHIITVEDPIEFLFEDKQSLIEQREIGTDSHSFAEALKHILRQDPDVILVGEMRDAESIATVLTAAETGHLVFSTLHTARAAEAVERIVDVFEGDKQRQILTQLASVLRIVVAQDLYEKKGGGLVAAREIFVNTPASANLIRQNNISQINSVIQTGAEEGMVPMDRSIEALISEGLVEEA